MSEIAVKNNNRMYNRLAGAGGGGATSPRVESREQRAERVSIAGAAISVQGCDDPSGSGLHAYWQYAL